MVQFVVLRVPGCKCDAVNCANELIQRILQQAKVENICVCILDNSECNRRSDCGVSGNLVKCCNEVEIPCNGSFEVKPHYPDVLIVAAKGSRRGDCSKSCIVVEIKLCLTKSMHEKVIKEIVEKFESIRSKYPELSCGSIREIVVVPRDHRVVAVLNYGIKQEELKRIEFVSGVDTLVKTVVNFVTRSRLPVIRRDPDNM